MMGLYYADGLFHNPYIEYLENRYPHTSYTTGWEHEMKSYIHTTGFEFIFLEIMPDDGYSKETVYRMAGYARKHSPESVIIIHGNYLGNRERLDFPLELYDLFIINQMVPEDLEEIIRALLLRRLFFICHQLPPRNLRGILCMRNPKDEVQCSNYLHTLGITTVISSNQEIIARNIPSFKPDFIVLHQHTREQDYDAVKKLCRDVRTRMPDCSIIITGSMIHEMVYSVSKAPFDEFIHYSPSPYELLLLVLRKEQLKYRREVKMVNA